MKHSEVPGCEGQLATVQHVLSPYEYMK